MAKEIKQRIVLEGEKEYNQAVKEAQRNLRTLRSELKAETAELGRNATEQQKTETRAKSLKKQIQEQEKVVATYRQALEEVREKYGDNEDAVAKWEQKLNEARATLGNMRSDLEAIPFQQAKMNADQATVAAKSFADSIGKIADAGEAISGTIESIFSGMVSTVSSAIGAVWEDMMDLAARANDWGDLAGFWNTDMETIQKWSRAVESAHDSFTDLQSAVSRINLGNQQKITEVTGVSGENYTDKWQYAMAVMDSLAKMDYDKRLEAAGEVFGEKRATKILNILNEWDKIQQSLNLYDKSAGGVGMTEEQMEDMATLAENVDKIKVTWRAFLDEFEAQHFAKLALDLTGNAQRILEDLIKFVDSGSDEDLANLEKDITEFFDRIKMAIEKAAEKLREAGEKLEESDNGIVKAIGKAMQGLAGALEWISEDENINKVIHGFEVLAGFWVAGKGVKLLGSIAELAANFKVISGFNAAGSVAGAAGAADGMFTSLSGVLGKLTFAVSLAAIATTVYPTLARLFKGESEEQKEAREQVEKVAEVGKALEEGGAQASKEAKSAAARDLLQYAFTGKTPNLDALIGDKTETATEEDGTQRVYVETSGPITPHGKRSGFDATAEQQAAAEALWDAWRSDPFGEQFEAAYEAYQKAFEGNEDTFRKLDQWIDRMMEDYEQQHGMNNFNEGDWLDLPASWWKNPAGTSDENGISSGDLQGFRSLPAGIITAAQRGVSQGISGIRVNLDGQTVGELVAPYVSQAIARDIG